MPQVNREELLNALESIAPGLSKREIVEQSSCFVFRGNRIITFNDEVACSTPNPLSIEGAVTAESFLNILRKMGEEFITVCMKDGHLTFKGKGGREGGVIMDAEVTLPVDSVDIPPDKGWKPIGPEFSEAISLVEKCAGSNEEEFSTTCVHLHPEHVEAYDNFQVARYKVQTKVKEPVLVRRSSIRHIFSLGMTKIAETDSWLHFTNPAGLVMSCRRFSLSELDPTAMLDVGSILDVQGKPAILPKGLVEAAERCQIFSSENSDGDTVQVQLRKGKLRITGTGVSGWFREVKSLKYEGPSLKFLIDPKLLTEIVQKHNECQITGDRLKVDGKRFTYVTCLGSIED